MLDADDGRRIYKYNSFIELSQFGLAIIAFLFVLFAFLHIFILVKIILNQVNLTTSAVLASLGNILGSIVWVAIWLSMVYSAPSVEIKEHGLRLKAFPLKSIFIEWDNISYVQRSRWKGLLQKIR